MALSASVRVGLRGALVAIAVALSSLAAAAPEHDERYAGFLTCDVLPGVTNERLKVEFSLTIANGKATYERERIAI